MTSARARLVLVLGGLLTAAGAVAVVTARTGVASFGWFAYAPLSATTFTPGGVVLGPQAVGGGVLGVVGLTAAAWAAGYLAGRRAHRD